MDRLNRLHVTAKTTYYLAWITGFAAVLLHLFRLNRLLLPLNLSPRNLLEGSLLLFVACAAAEMRALNIAAKDQMPQVRRGQAA